MLLDTCSCLGFTDLQGASQRCKDLLQCFSFYHDKSIRLNRYCLCIFNRLDRSTAYFKCDDRRLSHPAGVCTSEGQITYSPQRLSFLSSLLLWIKGGNLYISKVNLFLFVEIISSNGLDY